jgi:enoyl-CoA hydratase/carnithine racemase
VIEKTIMSVETIRGEDAWTVRLEMILTGRTLAAEEAVGIGLANQRVAPEALEIALQEILDRTRSLSPAVLRVTKKALLEIDALSWQDSLVLVEETYRNKLMHLPDPVEGLRAFMEKRPPQWEAKPRRES